MGTGGLTVQRQNRSSQKWTMSPRHCPGKPQCRVPLPDPLLACRRVSSGCAVLSPSSQTAFLHTDTVWAGFFSWNSKMQL